VATPAEPPDPRDVARLPANGPVGSFLEVVDAWLPGAWREPPLRGAVLIGGASTRMGQPKQLLKWRGRTFVERAVLALRGLDSVTLVGDGPVHPEAARLPRLGDAPGLRGPLAGILAALRSRPDAAWIVVGCDQPCVTDAAVAWLADRRAPGRWMVLPRLEDGRAQPLLALYDSRSLPALEELAESRQGGPSVLAGHARADTPSPPRDLAAAWTNVNTPEDLRSLPGAEG
jgi:molybdopterin-guanine dinucleotide biosynthesis protein A